MKFLHHFQPLALLLLRLTLALIFIYHGYPKLVHNSPQLREFFVQHGLPAYFVSLSGALECFGSLLLVLGLFTQATGLVLMIEMIVAIWKVHSGHGLIAVHEYEFPLAVAAACFALAAFGAGLFSMDHAVFGGSHAPRKRRSASRSSRERE